MITVWKLPVAPGPPCEACFSASTVTVTFTRPNRLTGTTVPLCAKCLTELRESA